jgi:CheY-like chemotaxis protein
MLKMTDTGCGMDPELLAHIFEPFFTTKGQGTGLGLATVYGVVKQSGGYISVTSALGRGSTFRIYFPRVAALDEMHAKPEPAATAIAEHRAVLLVDDEPALRKLTAKMLLGMGFAVLEAQDAFHAMEIARQSETVIDMILTDIMMPGMSGIDLAEKVSALRPETKVLYMSGYADGEIARHRGVRSGIAILRKPFTQDELARHMGEVTATVTQ